MSKVELEIDGAVGTITINRPEVRNALDHESAVEMAAAFDELDGRPEIAVAILTGAAGTFCSGMDLAAFARGERPSLPGRGLGGFTKADIGIPVIAAVEGWALAGGCELALACDMVVASREAKFGLPEAKRGLVAAGGGLARLAKVMPYQAAMELVLTGDPLGAEDAARLGLVNRLADPGEALDVARGLAGAVAANGPLSIRASKKALALSVGYHDRDLMDRQSEIIEPVMRSEDALEGARAFREKRPPVWQGR